MSVRLEQVRKARGLSQKELSRLSGVSQAHISDIESGKKNPTIQILERLAVALGVPTSQLIEDTHHSCYSKEASADATA